MDGNFGNCCGDERERAILANETHYSLLQGGIKLEKEVIADCVMTPQKCPSNLDRV